MELGYKKIFWGMLLTLININIGSVSNFIPFIGLLVILNGTEILYTHNALKEFKQASIFCIVAIVWTIISFFLSISTDALGEVMQLEPYPIVIALAVNLLMIYYIFMGSAKTLEQKNLIDLSNEYIKTTRIYTILFSMLTIVYIPSIGFGFLSMDVFLGIIGIVLKIWILIKIYGLYSLEIKEEKIRDSI